MTDTKKHAIKRLILNNWEFKTRTISKKGKQEMERTAGIEPASSAWKAEVIAIIRCTHIVGTR